MTSKGGGAVVSKFLAVEYIGLTIVGAAFHESTNLHCNQHNLQPV